jgi:hypothetical protein
LTGSEEGSREEASSAETVVGVLSVSQQQHLEVGFLSTGITAHAFSQNPPHK